MRTSRSLPRGLPGQCVGQTKDMRFFTLVFWHSTPSSTVPLDPPACRPEVIMSPKGQCPLSKGPPNTSNHKCNGGSNITESQSINVLD